MEPSRDKSVTLDDATGAHHEQTLARQANTSDVVVAALAVAVLVAFVHVVVFAIQLHVFDRRTFSSRELLWIAPLAYALWFLTFALPLAVGARLWPRVFTFGRVVGILSGVAVFGVLLLYPEIHPFAYALIGAGVAVRLAHVIDEHSRPWRRYGWRIAAVLLVGLVVTALTRDGLLLWREQRALAAHRTATAGAPNVLLLILDTVRSSNLSAYGYARPTTPVLDTLARQGLLFEWAFSPASWTLPSHASMLSGRWAAGTGTSYLSGVPDELPLLTEVLRERGYVTGGFMGNAGWAGWETGLQRGFLRFETYPLDRSQLLCCTTFMRLPFFQEIVAGVVSIDPARAIRAFREPDFTLEVARSPGKRNAAEITSRFLAWRARVGERHPYFAMLNFLDAHDPAPPAPYDTMFNDGATRLDRYDGTLAYMDRVIGELVDTLSARGELDQTILIVTSDHGEQFGEHRLFGHGNSVYLPVVHTPLVIRYPKRLAAGTRRAEPVSLRDLPATVLDLLDDGTSRESRLGGQSLLGAPEPGADPAVLVHASRAVNKPEQPNASGPIHGLIDGEWHYIRYADGVEELFAWRADPAEREDLVDDPVGQDALRRLRARAAELLGDSTRPPLSARPR